MKKEVPAIGFVILILFIFLSGCNDTAPNPETNKFIGTWVYTDEQDGTTVTFSSDGTFVYGIAGHMGTWTAQDGELHYVSDGESATQTYTFSSNNTTLRIGPRDTFGFQPGNYTKQ